MFCLLLNAEQLLVPDYHMMDMNIISLVTISLLMVSAYELRGTVAATGGNRIDIYISKLGVRRTTSAKMRRLHQILDRTVVCYCRTLALSTASSDPSRSVQTVLHTSVETDGEQQATKAMVTFMSITRSNKHEGHISSSFTYVAAETDDSPRGFFCLSTMMG